MHEACCNLLDCTDQLQSAAAVEVKKRMMYFVNGCEDDSEVTEVTP